MVKYCHVCVEEYNINIREKRIRPTFGPPGGKFMRCKEHKLETDINLDKYKCKKCINCKISPAYYGLRFNQIKKYCEKCKPYNYVNCRTKFCQGENDTCMIKPSYGYKGKQTTRCVKHVLPGMISSCTKCIKCGKKYPLFGKILKKPIHCGDCKEKDEYDVWHDLCDCGKRASYGVKGDKKVTRCSKHKLENDVNVIKPRCREKGCIDIPLYGEKGKLPTHCKDHKKPNQVYIALRKCRYEGCGKYPSFGLEWKKPLYCNGHKDDKHIDVRHNRCKSCNLFMISDDKQFCSYCNPNKRQKTRENKIKFYLEKHVDHEFAYDKCLQHTWCGKYRPDFSFDCGTHFVIIECDEDQHDFYDKECEIVRMKNIVHSNGMKTVFLRYNPDTYTTNEIKPAARLKVLCERLNHYMENIPDEFLSVEYLYYDNKHLTFTNIPLE